jgi:Prohead core protein serine protease
MKQLLVEYNAIQYDNIILTEASDITKPLILRNVILQRANSRNQNGRVYPKDILLREAKIYKDNFVGQRRALGELDHPESPVVNLKNVCSNVTDLWFEGDDVMGNIEVLSTPAGNIVRELIKNNIRLGVSSRGMGSVKQMGEASQVEVQDDFALICFDIVSNPSTYGAFINESSAPQILSAYAKVDALIHNFLSEIK